MDTGLALHMVDVSNNFSLDVAEIYWQHCLEQRTGA